MRDKAAAQEPDNIPGSRHHIAATAQGRRRNRVVARIAHSPSQSGRSAQQPRHKTTATRTATERKNPTALAHSAVNPAPSPLGG